MTKQDVIKYFGSPKEAIEAIGISKGAFSQWGDEVPALRQYQIEVLSNGELVAERLND